MVNNVTWHDVLAKEKEKSYFRKMLARITAERTAGKIIYPSQQDVFNVFRLTKLSAVKVVILGQDPYHQPNQAHGLAFSVLSNVAVPPSLINIYKELREDLHDFQLPHHGFLESWARQGVMLLNTVLTVEAGRAHSHSHFGWEIFTDQVIAAINQHREGVVFLLWGYHAQKKGNIIDRQRHHVLQASHPSPLAAYRGFFGCRHFSKTNQWLIEKGEDPIDWTPHLLIG